MSDSDSDSSPERATRPRRRRRTDAKSRRQVESSSSSEANSSSSESERRSNNDESGSGSEPGSDVEQIALVNSDDEEKEKEERKARRDRRKNGEASDEEQEEKHEVATGSFELPLEEHAKIWVLTGVPASGKSYMMRYLMYLYGKERYFKGGGLVFSPSAYNGDYDFLPEKALKDKFDPDYLAAYIDNLKRKVREGKEKHGRDWKLPHNFLILDDCLGTLNNNSEMMSQLFSCHRQHSTSIFILNQYLAANRNVSTLMRNVTNYSMMWPQTLKNSIDAMYNAFGQMFDNLEEFKNALNQCRRNKYSCLLYINSVEIESKDDAYRIIKAGQFPEFRLLF